ncbi:MAG: tyrosine-protein phosphatase [Candidatus Limnocylindria bacterium]
MTAAQSPLERRHFDWEGCFNARDLGGLPLHSGGVTRHGVFVRGDTLCDLTADGRRSLLDDGVRTVVDLRGDEEIANEPNPFAEIAGVRYIHRPLNDPGVVTKIQQVEDAVERYRIMLDENAERIAAIVTVIAEAERSVLFHCFAGRDRTGIIAAILLRIVGVPDDVIVADYAVSDERLATRYEQWRAKQTPEQRARMDASIVEAEETIRGTLDHLDARYGGVEGYLTANGVPESLIARVRADLAA